MRRQACPRRRGFTAGRCALPLQKAVASSFLPTIGAMLVAEELVGEARERRASQMVRREKVVTRLAAGLFVVAAVAIAVLIPDERGPDPLLVAGLVVGYALLLQVRFEFGGRYGSAEPLVFVPLLLYGPLPLRPAPRGARRPALAAARHPARQLAPRPDAQRARRLLGAGARRAGARLLAPGPLDTADLDVYAIAVAALRRQPRLGRRAQRSRGPASDRRGRSRRGQRHRRRVDVHPDRVRGRRRRPGRAARPARHRSRSPGSIQLFSLDRARALHDGARAPARLPRHGDAALRRRRVRGQLHGATTRARWSSS